MLAHRLLKRHDDESRGGIRVDVEVRETSRPAPRRRLLCRSCGAPVTAETERVAIDGQHVHRRTNPAGIDFEFGCFAAARGAESVGDPTPEFSWFSGYTWMYSVCRTCAAHLGWRFEGDGPSFHGLILARLVPESSGETLH
jgi:hypothetical protein